MREKILEFVKAGDAQGLRIFLLSNLNNKDVAELLNQDDSLISQIIMDIYGPLVCETEEVSASDDKLKIKGIESAMKIVVAFGAKPPQGEAFSEQVYSNELIQQSKEYLASFSPSIRKSGK